MQIAFWSPYSGQTGTTTATLVYGAMTALMNNYKVLLTHNDYKGSILEQCLVTRNVQSNEDVAYFKDHGIDALIRLVRNKRLAPGMFKDYTTSLLANMNLDLLESDSSKADQLTEEDLYIVKKIYQTAANDYDLVFVDLTNGNPSQLTTTLLDTSDIVVVCLNQNTHLIERYLSEEDSYGILKNKKVIYHIGHYDKKSRSSLKNLKRKYQFDQVLALPNHHALMDACNQNQCLDFLMRHYNTKKFDEVHGLIEEIKKNTAYFMSMIHSIEQEVMYQHA